MKRRRLFFSVLLSILTLFINGPLITTAQSPPSSSTSCNRICGGIEIPFPFGIGRRDCFLNDWYEVVCNSTTSGKSLAPFLYKINRELVSITLRSSIDSSYGVVHIKSPVTSSGCSQRPVKPLPLNLTGKGSPFFITDSNRLVSVGCDNRALITDIESQITGCESSCDGDKSRLDKITERLWRMTSLDAKASEQELVELAGQCELPRSEAIPPLRADDVEQFLLHNFKLPGAQWNAAWEDQAAAFANEELSK